MKFDFFEKLNGREAKVYLENFLVEASAGFSSLIPILATENIFVDYSIESINPVLNWVVKNLKTIPKESDAALPKWITDTEIYKKGLYSFDDFSNVLILRLAYYFGECFVRNNQNLFWTTGAPKFAEKNMPVIAGFMKEMELAPMLVCENLVRRILGGQSINTVDIAVTTWQSFILESE